MGKKDVRTKLHIALIFKAYLDCTDEGLRTLLIFWDNLDESIPIYSLVFHLISDYLGVNIEEGPTIESFFRALYALYFFDIANFYYSNVGSDKYGYFVRSGILKTSKKYFLGFEIKDIFNRFKEDEKLHTAIYDAKSKLDDFYKKVGNDAKALKEIWLGVSELQVKLGIRIEKLGTMLDQQS